MYVKINEMERPKGNQFQSYMTISRTEAETETVELLTIEYLVIHEQITASL